MRFLLLPVVGALVGWITNLVALLLLFRPHRPVRIPFTGFTIQGLLPRHKAELAQLVGQTVELELLTLDDLTQHLLSPDVQNELRDHLVLRTVARIHQRIPAYLPRRLVESVVDFVRGWLREELDDVIAGSVEQLMGTLQERARLASLVEERVNNLDMRQLEALITGLASRELRHIQLIGGVLGFIIGFLQLVLLQLVT